ncbi:MAG: O-antigen ligase family protein [Candidatus Omnitrophica bacterium]|nr:O-antigen ligase family protein [Candidatus Omnitrophota bacterium]
MSYLILALILIRPFISSLAYPYANTVYSSILIISLLSWLLLNKPSRGEFRRLLPPAICFFAAMVLSSCLSADKTRSFFEYYKYLSGMLLVFMLPGLDNKDRGIYIKAILSCGVVIGILAIYQYFIGFEHLRRFVETQNINSSFVLDYLRQKRVFFPFVTPGVLAGYLAMTFPLTLLYKKTLWLSAPLLLCALFLTESIGALISLFIGMLIMISLTDSPARTKSIIALAVFIIIPIAFFMRIIPGRDHLSPLFSLSMRVDYWKNTLEIIKTHPFLGVGPGNFNLVYSRYAHNSLLQFMAETGVFGLLSLTWFVCAAAAPAIRSILAKKESLILFVSLAIFAIHNLMDFSFFLPEASLSAWAILGLLVKSES